MHLKQNMETELGRAWKRATILSLWWVFESWILPESVDTPLDDPSSSDDEFEEGTVAMDTDLPSLFHSDTEEKDFDGFDEEL